MNSIKLSTFIVKKTIDQNLKTKNLIMKNNISELKSILKTTRIITKMSCTVYFINHTKWYKCKIKLAVNGAYLN